MVAKYKKLRTGRQITTIIRDGNTSGADAIEDVCGTRLLQIGQGQKIGPPKDEDVKQRWT